jgi:hypothetical protein
MKVDLTNDERHQIVLGQAIINIGDLIQMELPSEIITSLEATDAKARIRYQELFEKVNQPRLIQKLDPNSEFQLEGSPIPVV